MCLDAEAHDGSAERLSRRVRVRVEAPGFLARTPAGLGGLRPGMPSGDHDQEPGADAPAVREHLGWIVHESGPAGAQHAVLMMPGGLLSWVFFQDVVGDLERRPASLRFVATTLPGHAGTPPPEDLSPVAYARAAARLANDLGCDVVVGHSMGATVAIEMAASGGFSGPMVLLSPALSREDEPGFIWALDRIGGVPGLGGLAWGAMVRTVPMGMKRMIPPEHREAWMAELKKNDGRSFRAAVHAYGEYLGAQTSLVRRLCESGVKAHVVFGGPKDTKLTDDERDALTSCPNISLVEWPDAGHNTPGQTKPLADLIVAAASQA
jgi:pimeloyl-ACP methyl ester carboxylesterase